MWYKILNDKNAWNEILTQFGECDSLPNSVCALLSQAHMLKINRDHRARL